MKNNCIKQYFDKNYKYILRIIILLILLQITIYTAYAISITKIMFNPLGADTGREWIELQLNETDGCINLTEYTLFEENTNHHIYAYNKYYTCNYAIIYSDITKFFQDYNYLNDSYFPLYKSTFNLNNNGEMLSIKYNNTTVYEINYTQLIIDTNISEGHSLEYKNNSWKTSELLGGDPGNIIEDALKITDNNTYNNNNSNNNDSNFLTNTTSNIISNNISNYINNNTNNSEYDNNNNNNNNNSNITNILNNNITNNNITDNNITSNVSNDITFNTCSASINISIKNESIIYENNKQIKFYNLLDISYNNTNITKKEANYSIEYWIEDLFGNKIKETVITNNQNEKTFTPNIAEEDKILKIKNILKSINCNITANSYEKIILIKNSNYQSIPIICEKCKVSSTKCEEKTSSQPIISFKCNSSIIENNTIKPLIKIINICNKTDQVQSYNINNSLYTYGTAGKEILNNEKTNNNTLNSITTTKNTSQSASRTTSMIIYESGNLKNRVYAMIGIILVSLTGIIILFKKIYNKKTSDE